MPELNDPRTGVVGSHFIRHIDGRFKTDGVIRLNNVRVVINDIACHEATEHEQNTWKEHQQLQVVLEERVTSSSRLPIALAFLFPFIKRPHYLALYLYIHHYVSDRLFWEG